MLRSLFYADLGPRILVVFNIRQLFAGMLFELSALSTRVTQPCAFIANYALFQRSARKLLADFDSQVLIIRKMPSFEALYSGVLVHSAALWGPQMRYAP